MEPGATALTTRNRRSRNSASAPDCRRNCTCAATPGGTGSTNTSAPIWSGKSFSGNLQQDRYLNARQTPIIVVGRQAQSINRREVAMTIRVADILRHKNGGVVTTPRTTTVYDNRGRVGAVITRLLLLRRNRRRQECGQGKGAENAGHNMLLPNADRTRNRRRRLRSVPGIPLGSIRASCLPRAAARSCASSTFRPSRRIRRSAGGASPPPSAASSRMRRTTSARASIRGCTQPRRWTTPSCSKARSTP